MRSRFSILLLVGFLFTLFLGCSSPPEGENQGTGDGDSLDGDGEGQNSDADGDGEQGCLFQVDCAEDEFCHDGECLEAPTCNNINAWRRCVERFEEIDEDLARRAFCDGEFCRVSCLTDEECPDEMICSDHGRCIDFTGELTGVHPGGDSPSPLQAGVSNTLMNFPIGLSQGGYGSRAASNAGRYVESLQPTLGKMHGLYARSLVVDDGTRQLLFMRAPIIFPSMALHESVARRLQEETGRDWRHSLAISGTHTHSGPGRFWHIPRPETVGLTMGTLGIDEFSQQVYDWLVDSLTESALDALADLRPAKMGWTVVESFDTDDVISSDRWSQTPPFDDNRILLLRVDDLDDTPRGVLMSFGSHGTVHSGSYMNGDVMVGMERVIEYALGEEFGTFAPVMYFNQNGGNISPRGDRLGHRHTHRYEELGYLLHDRIFTQLLEMETTDQWSFGGHTHRFPMIYEYFGYGLGEFGARGANTRDDAYLFGGLACNLDSGEDYSTHVEPGEYSCLGIHQITFHRPISLFAKSQISSFQLNDLTIVTMPGELTMPMGWQVQRDIRDAYGIDPFDSFTWGYAQDHLLYLTPTNLRGDRPPFPGLSLPEHYQSLDDLPDFALSYLQGGYESQMSPWGHKLGDFLAARAVEAVGLMLGEEIEPEFHVPLPDQFSYLEETPFPIDTSDPEEVGRIVAEPPAQVERRQFIDFAWRGGDPGAEMPQAPLVTLERLEGDEFVEVLNKNRLPYTNREFLMLTRTRRSEEHREWAVYWEELKDFPLGTYRFRINGHYLSPTTGERTPYETHTRAFELVPSSAIAITEVTSLSDTQIRFRLSYPAADELSTFGIAGDRGKPSGSFRLHHRLVPSGQPIPLDPDEDIADLQISVHQNGDPLIVEGYTASVEFESMNNRTVPVTWVTLNLTTPLAPVGFEFQATVVDAYQNSGEIAVTIGD